MNHGSKKGADGKYENLQVVLVDLISTQDSGMADLALMLPR